MDVARVPRISVILPTWNRAACLRRAIQSVHRFLFVDRVLATVHVQHDSISFDPTRALRNRRDRERVLDKIFARQDLPADAARMKATAYANLHTESALRCWNDRQPRAAWRALRRALLQEGHRARVLARFCFFALANGPLRHQTWWRALPRAVRRAAWR
jgi:hypothetical protein